MEGTMKKNTGYDEKQIKDARQLCGIINNVPGEKRNLFVAVANAYMDGVIAGEAIASGAVK